MVKQLQYLIYDPHYIYIYTYHYISCPSNTPNLSYSVHLYSFIIGPIMWVYLKVTPCRGDMLHGVHVQFQGIRVVHLRCLVDVLWILKVIFRQNTLFFLGGELLTLASSRFAGHCVRPQLSGTIMTTPHLHPFAHDVSWITAGPANHGCGSGRSHLIRSNIRSLPRHSNPPQKHIHAFFLGHSCFGLCL